ncbi:MAG: hypothetical protein AB1758_36790, partial [Candidatus Eremiobacterota bacterium]
RIQSSTSLPAPPLPTRTEIEGQREDTYVQMDQLAHEMALQRALRREAAQRVPDFARSQRDTLAALGVVAAAGVGLGVLGVAISIPLAVFGVLTVGVCGLIAGTMWDDRKMVRKGADEAIEMIDRELAHLGGMVRERELWLERLDEEALRLQEAEDAQDVVGLASPTDPGSPVGIEPGRVLVGGVAIRRRVAPDS